MHLICKILQPFILALTGGLTLNVVKMGWPHIPKLMQKSRLESVPPVNFKTVTLILSESLQFPILASDPTVSKISSTHTAVPVPDHFGNKFRDKSLALVAH